MIDTNIFIPAEDDGGLPRNVEDLFKKAHSGGHSIRVHEATLLDLNRDANTARKAASISRFNKYSKIPNCSRTEAELSSLFGPIKSENDLVDCRILSALLNGVVDLVISEDVGLLKRGARAGLADGCLAVRDALLLLSEKNWLAETSQTFIRNVSCAEINLNDPIFDSLRADYDFDKWFRDKCIKEERRAWIAESDGRYAGIVIFNEERLIDADPGVVGSKILKLCTFKIAEFARGKRLGELFLRKALWFAKNNAFDAVYYTAFPKQTALIALSAGLGFQEVSARANGEKTMARQMILKVSARGNFLNDVAANYPNVPITSLGGLIIPIKPEFHEKLFPEASETRRGQTLPLFSPTVNAPEATEVAPAAAIRKAYLGTTQMSSVRRGTPLLFYLTKSPEMAFSQCATAYGVAEQFIEATSMQEILKVARLRTVFTEEDLELLLRRKGYLKVLKFLFVGYLSKPAPLSDLVKRKIIAGPPQSFANVNGTALSKLIAEVGLAHSPQY